MDNKEAEAVLRTMGPQLDWEKTVDSDGKITWSASVRVPGPNFDIYVVETTPFDFIIVGYAPAHSEHQQRRYPSADKAMRACETHVVTKQWDE